MKSYNQYCPVAHALDVVGERWSLLIVRELIEHEQLRYSDLHANLVGCGTNILAARLKDLERHGVVDAPAPPPSRRVDRLRADRVRAGASPGDARARALGRTLARPADAGRGSRARLARRCDADGVPSATDGCADRVSGRRRGRRRSSTERCAKDRSRVRTQSSSAIRPTFFHFVVDRDVDCLDVHGDAQVVHDLLDGLPYAEEPQGAAAATS